MNSDLGTCKRSLLTDGKDTKKRKLEESSTNPENPSIITEEDSKPSIQQPIVEEDDIKSNIIQQPIKTEGDVKPSVGQLQPIVKEEDIKPNLLAQQSIKKEDDVKPNIQLQQTLDRIKRKKVLLLLSYSGWGYLGMQRNPGAKTIEDDLLQALHVSGLITQEHFKHPQRMLFQRAARTDKGVSAVRQVVSLKLPEDTDLELINKELPDQIRVVCMKRTTKGFNAKTSCDARTYSYVVPTFAFSPGSEEPSEPSESFRITEEIRANVNNILKMFVGTHNFHNFTSKRGFAEASSNRYIMSFSCGEPFLKAESEYVVLSVKGQSFMQHHIRKMIGLTIAIARGYTTTDTIARSFKSEALDIPKAPGLGLMLEEVHYDWYNNQYGKDGVHEALEWSKYEDYINEFKDKHIISNIIKTEKEEKSMLSWMATLSGHSYSVRVDRPPTSEKIVASSLPKAEIKKEEKSNTSKSEMPILPKKENSDSQDMKSEQSDSGKVDIESEDSKI